MIINTDHRGRNRGMFARGFQIEWEPDDFPPDSNYWRMDAIQAKTELEQMIGVKNYNLWSEMTWPEDEINKHTFKELAHDFRAAIEIGKDALLSMLECGCVLPNQHCIVCCAQARITARVEEML